MFTTAKKKDHSNVYNSKKKKDFELLVPAQTLLLISVDGNF